MGLLGKIASEIKDAQRRQRQSDKLVEELRSCIKQTRSEAKKWRDDFVDCALRGTVPYVSENEPGARLSWESE